MYCSLYNLISYNVKYLQDYSLLIGNMKSLCVWNTHAYLYEGVLKGS